MQQCIKMFIIAYLYEAQHVSGDTPPIIRSLKLHWQPLVFHTWKVVWTCSWWTLSGTVCLTTCLTMSTNYMSKQPSTYEETRGCQCRFRLLMMGGVSPKTCWASYKYGIIKKLIHCCILLDFSLRSFFCMGPSALYYLHAWRICHWLHLFIIFSNFFCL